MQNRLNCTILIWGLILREGLVLAGGKNTGRLRTAGGGTEDAPRYAAGQGSTLPAQEYCGVCLPSQAPGFCQVARARCTLTLLEQLPELFTVHWPEEHLGKSSQVSAFPTCPPPSLLCTGNPQEYCNLHTWMPLLPGLGPG